MAEGFRFSLVIGALSAYGAGYRARTATWETGVPPLLRTAPDLEPSPSSGSSWVSGGDLDYSDLARQDEPQAILGWDLKDPHRLDGDRNGEACESLS